jgi:hypothetical protein
MATPREQYHLGVLGLLCGILGLFQAIAVLIGIIDILNFGEDGSIWVGLAAFVMAALAHILMRLIWHQGERFRKQVSD